MSRFAIVNQIRQLDPETDNQRIVYLSSCYDFPFDTTRALEFALFRTFCLPRISALLDKTGEFQNRAQKRYDDTDIIVSELVEWGYTSERGARALQRLNAIHSRFNIANEDFLYVLSSFIYEPIRWNARFGWRPMCEQERLGMFYFWREVGRRMEIIDLPGDYHTFERFNREFERAHCRRTEANYRVGKATTDLFVSWFPQTMSPLVRSAIHALMDEKMRDAFGFPPPRRLLSWMTIGGLKSRARVVRWLPPRRKPRLRTQMKHRTYPKGYHIEQLGPPGGQ